MSHNIDELYTTLFATLQAAKDGTMEAERIKLIGDTAQVIINAAKVEVEHAKVVGGSGSAFINSRDPRTLLPGETTREATGTGTKTIHALAGGATVTTHKMRG
jgi:hypothetical protein